MSKMFFNITWKEGQPTLQTVRQKYGLQPDEVDAEFGVIAIDPAEHLYTILVEEAAVRRLQNQSGASAQDFKGPYSNPHIEPFGPPAEPPVGDKPKN